jgi:hypothetical protein
VNIFSIFDKIKLLAMIIRFFFKQSLILILMITFLLHHSNATIEDVFVSNKISLSRSQLSNLDFTVSATTINCFGDNSGILTLAIQGGTAPFDLNWSGTQYDNTLVSCIHNNISVNYDVHNLYAGNYLVTIIDGLGNERTKTIAINQPNELGISVNRISDIMCNNASNGEISLNIFQEGEDVSNYPLVWTGPGGFYLSGTVESVSSIGSIPSAGVYTASISYNGSCEASLSVEISEPLEIVVASIVTDVTCYNGNDGEIAITVSGGISPYTYVWASVSGTGINQGQASQRNLSAGVYDLSIMDSNGCTFSETFVIKEALPIDFNLDIVQPFCEGNNGEIIIKDVQGGSGNYEFSCNGGTYWQNSNHFTSLSSGNHTVIARDENACLAAKQVTLNESVKAEISSPSSEICGYSFNLEANDPHFGTGVWSVIAGNGYIQNPLEPNTIVNGISEGRNVYRWTVIGETCTSFDDVEIYNNKVIVDAGSDQNVCGRTATLHAEQPLVGIGEWGLMSGVGSATFRDGYDPNSQVGGLSNGDNGFVWKVTYNGCVSFDEVYIQNDNPYPVNAGYDQVIHGDRTALNATPVNIGLGQWSLVSGGATIEDIHDPYTKVNGLIKGTTTFRWTVTNKNCLLTDEATITNGSTAVANAGLDQVICKDETSLQGNDPDMAIGEWTVVCGAGVFKDVYDPTTQVSDLMPGTNVFRWTIYNNDSSTSDDVEVTNNSVTQADAGADIIVNQEAASLNANIPTYGIGQWSLIDGSADFSDRLDPHANVTGLSVGDNQLRWTIQNEYCTSVDDVIVLYNLPTSIESSFDDEFQIYPKPTRSVLNIKVKSKMVIDKLDFYSVNGELVLSKSDLESGSPHKIDLRYLKPGLYIIHIVTKDGFFYQDRIIKQ